MKSRSPTNTCRSPSIFRLGASLRTTKSAPVPNSSTIIRFWSQIKVWTSIYYKIIEGIKQQKITSHCQQNKTTLELEKLNSKESQDKIYSLPTKSQIPSRKIMVWVHRSHVLCQKFIPTILSSSHTSWTWNVCGLGNVFICLWVRTIALEG